MKELVCEHMQALSAQLLGGEGMHSEEAGQRSAALRVLGTLARHDFDAVKAGVMEVMRDDLDAAPLLAFSARDIAVYRTPAGELAKNADMDSGYVCKV